MASVSIPSEIGAIVRRLEPLAAGERIAWALGEYGERLTFACSFGAEDMVVLDLLEQVRPGAPVFVLDTGRLHQETYDLMDQARQHYGRSFEVLAPRTEALEALLAEYGPNGFYRSVGARRRCCEVRKVEPLSRALSGKDAWMTGLRRQQSVTRTLLPLAQIDAAHRGITKLNPLADWSEEDVWIYLREHRVPYNALHEQGFPSIGCVPCTRAVAPGEGIRAGRWWWEVPEQRECGLHPPADEVDGADRQTRDWRPLPPSTHSPH